jgi:NADH:ubiquinone oxidoreductase subunit 5 (subunit L)/multisubunit Na+/H+ antiporter MnhA subunit
MDLLQSLLALVALAAPLVAAAAITCTGSSNSAALPRRLAMLGAGLSFGAGAAALLRISSGGPDGELPFRLGTWLCIGPRDPFRIDFAIALDLPAAVLATVMSLSTVCALNWSRRDSADGFSDRLLFIAASLLLSSSLAIVMSTNVGELFLFWQIASVSAYLMMSSGDETASGAAAAKKLMLMQRAAEFWLLCAILALAIGYQTFDYDKFFADLQIHGARQHFALVHFIGLCLVGACAARCALIPFLGSSESLVTSRTLVGVMIEGICLMPAGVLLLIRFLPVLHVARATAAFAVLLGATSAFFAAVCAWTETDARRQAGFACASVFGLIVMGLSLGIPAANGWAVVLTATFVPTSAAVLGWFSDRSRARQPGDLGATAVAVAIVLLFAGICGQGGILGAGLLAFAQGIPPGRPALLLDLAFGGSATYFAAFAMTRAILAQRFANELASPLSTSAARTDRFEIFSAQDARDSRWSLIVLTACGAAIGLGGGALMLAPRQISGMGMSPVVLAGGSLVATVIGCLPAFAGVFVGWGQARPEQARQEQATEFEPAFEGLLTRLGRNRFYCDPLLFVLLALPVRATAQFARFVDWFFIDGFVSGAPASAVEAAGLMLEPVQGRSVIFYLASAVVGTALLAAVVISLRY